MSSPEIFYDWSSSEVFYEWSSSPQRKRKTEVFYDDIERQRPAPAKKKEEEPKKTNIRALMLVKPASEGLTPPQTKALRLICDGHNVFLTGCSGSGKSFLLRRSIETLRKVYTGEGQVAVTASTGMAAYQIDGITIHRWAGIGSGNDSSYVNRVRRDPAACKRWKDVRVLVLDEISMIKMDVFEKLNELAKAMKKAPNVPFGGIQLLLCGDFYQLPPVDGNNRVRFAFESPAWSAIAVNVCLPQSLRQTDEGFCQLLDQVRTATLSRANVEILRRLASVTVSEDALYLASTRAMVEGHNDKKLRAIVGATHTYLSTDSGELTGEELIKRLSGFMAVPRLILKAGARVTLIKNLSPTLTNGAMGIVSAFEEDGDYPIIDFDDGQREVIRGETFTDEEMRGERRCVLAKRVQLPLLLGWANTIHKSQGQTLEGPVVVDLTSCFQPGQVYVALSRVRELSQLKVKAFDPKKVKVAPGVKEFMEKTHWDVS